MFALILLNTICLGMQVSNGAAWSQRGYSGGGGKGEGWDAVRLCVLDLGSPGTVLRD